MAFFPVSGSQVDACMLVQAERDPAFVAADSQDQQDQFLVTNTNADQTSAFHNYDDGGFDFQGGFQDDVDDFDEQAEGGSITRYALLEFDDRVYNGFLA